MLPCNKLWRIRGVKYSWTSILNLTFGATRPTELSALRSGRNLPPRFSFVATAPQWARASSFTWFLDHTQRRTTFGKNPLDECSARRRDLYNALTGQAKRMLTQKQLCLLTQRCNSTKIGEALKGREFLYRLSNYQIMKPTSVGYRLDLNFRNYSYHSFQNLNHFLCYVYGPKYNWGFTVRVTLGIELNISSQARGIWWLSTLSRKNCIRVYHRYSAWVRKYPGVQRVYNTNFMHNLFSLYFVNLYMFR